MLSVVIPWRPQPSRLTAFDTITEWYSQALPDAVVDTVDSDDDLFNLARCRNLGVAAAAERFGPDEVVVIGDADTVPQLAPLLAAIEAARTSGLVHLPYTEYHWLGRVGTAQLLAGVAAEACEFELVRGACSGVYVTTPRTWLSHGGQDERFRGWGFEDAAWYVAHETLLGAPPQRHPGSVFALHHETQLREGPQYDANAALMEQYRAASASAEAMTQFVFGDEGSRFAATASSAASARIRPGV